MSLSDPNVAIHKIHDMKNKIDIILNSNTPLSVKDLAVDGGTLIRELQLKPGKIVGDILSHLLEIVLKNPEINNYDSLINEAKIYISK